MRMMTNEILSHNLTSNHVRQLYMLRCFFSFSLPPHIKKKKKEMSTCINAFFNDTIATMSGFVSIISKTFFAGPIRCYYPDKSNRISIAIILAVALFDLILYMTVLYLSIQTRDQLYNLQKSTSETVDMLLRTQDDLYEFIRDVVRNETSNQSLLDQSLQTLRTLQFFHQDIVTTIQKNVNESLQLFESGSSECILFSRISFYTYTVALLLYIEQVILWIFQYLIVTKSNKYWTHSVILSITMLTQSLGLIYFSHLTHISLLYLYKWIFFIRSSMTMYYYSLST